MAGAVFTHAPRCVMRLPSACGTIGRSRQGAASVKHESNEGRGVSMSKYARRLALAVLLSCGVFAAQAQVTISQVYGGGGNSGAPLKSDFIELHNNGTSAVSLSGWSVQYASATGTSWQVTTLSGSIAPGGYYLVKEADGAGTQAAAADPGRHRHHRDERHRRQGRAEQQHRRAQRRLPDRQRRLRRLRQHRKLRRRHGTDAGAEQHARRAARGRRLHRQQQQRRRLRHRRTDAAQYRIRAERLRRRRATGDCRSPTSASPKATAAPPRSSSP